VAARALTPIPPSCGSSMAPLGRLRDPGVGGGFTRRATPAARRSSWCSASAAMLTRSTFTPASNAFSAEIADLLFPRLAESRTIFATGPRPSGVARALRGDVAGSPHDHVPSRSPARWSDGAESLGRRDLLASRRDQLRGGCRRRREEQIADVSAAGPHTVVYRFARAYPYALMDAVEGNILPAHVYGKIPSPNGRSTASSTRR